jgi:phosphatidylserine/phosphatidylglycerophosphate/cardiolipin synthase-like enzyme
MFNGKKLGIPGILLLALHADPSSAAPTSTDAQLVQSIPAETALAQPDLPFAKDAWVQLIRNTHSTLEMGQFYLASNSGGPLNAVIEELERAGARGVKIRLLLCPKMVSQDPDTYRRIQAIRGIEVRMLDLEFLHGVLHAKYFISDQETIFVGSQNFDWRALVHIHETGIVLKNRRVAKQLESIFDSDWNLAGEKNPSPLPIVSPLASPLMSPSASPDSQARVELVASPPSLNPAGIPAALPELLHLIGSAKQSIHATVMSYSLSDRYGGKYGARKDGLPPLKWTEIDDAIRAAAARGVKVEFMVSDWSVGEGAIDDLKSLAQVPGVEIRIVSIPEAKSGHIPYARVTHSKFMVVDGNTLWLGTSNWERNYFYGSRNIELILRDKTLAHAGERIYRKLWQSQYAEKIDQNRKYIPRKQN